MVWDRTGFLEASGLLCGGEESSQQLLEIHHACAREAPASLSSPEGRAFPRAWRSAGPVKPVDAERAAFRVFPSLVVGDKILGKKMGCVRNTLVSMGTLVN